MVLSMTGITQLKIHSGVLSHSEYASCLLTSDDLDIQVTAAIISQPGCPKIDNWPYNMEISCFLMGLLAYEQP